MPDEDQPPEHIWLNDEALQDHFAQVRKRYSSDSNTESVPDAGFQQNELTKGLKSG